MAKHSIEEAILMARLAKLRTDRHVATFPKKETVADPKAMKIANLCEDFGCQRDNVRKLVEAIMDIKLPEIQPDRQANLGSRENTYVGPASILRSRPAGILATDHIVFAQDGYPSSNSATHRVYILGHDTRNVKINDGSILSAATAKQHLLLWMQGAKALYSFGPEALDAYDDNLDPVPATT